MSLRIEAGSTILYGDVADFQPRLQLKLQDKNTITLNDLEDGEFSGDVKKAMEYLQDFCNTHSVRIESLGGGDNELFIDAKKHDITPFGISLKMMLEFCGGKTAADFPA